jgi:hypothetical protein
MNSSKYALLSTPEGKRYGTIISTHRSAESAQAAYDRVAARVSRRNPDALIDLMYEVSALPTPAGRTGTKGQRIAIDLTR